MIASGSEPPPLGPPDDDRETGTHTIPSSAHETAAPPSRPYGRLACVVGDALGCVYALRAPSVVIGRGSDAQIRIDCADVSRQHARITREDNGTYYLEDLGSRNGTSVNGLPAWRRALAVGDSIQIGTSAIFVFTYHDEIEQRAVRLQKLDALAALAGGMVHDFRNILSVVLANAESLERMLAAPVQDREEALRCIRDICEAAETGNSTTRRLLYFARRDHDREHAANDVAALVGEVLALARSTMSPRHLLQVDIAPNLEVIGNRDELQHALLNLCLNARDAMPDGGTLTLRGRARDISRADALRQHLPRSGAFVEITVTDTGTGMDEATLARIFEPFFTTKGPGAGTGLGLSTSFGVIRHHGGNIFVESAPGAGTTFRIVLPASS